MPVSDCELTQMFEHVLTLSKVDLTQSVAVLKSHYSDPRTVRAAMDAAQRLGPRCMRWSCRRSTIPRRWAMT